MAAWALILLFLKKKSFLSDTFHAWLPGSSSWERPPRLGYHTAHIILLLGQEKKKQGKLLLCKGSCLSILWGHRGLTHVIRAEETSYKSTTGGSEKTLPPYSHSSSHWHFHIAWPITVFPPGLLPHPALLRGVVLGASKPPCSFLFLQRADEKGSLMSALWLLASF